MEILGSDGSVQSVFVDADTGQVTKATVDARDTESGAGNENNEQGGQNGENEAD